MQSNNYLKEIKTTKTKIAIDNSWYYHDYVDDLEVLANILDKGILCKKELGIKKNTTDSYNGLHYVSITKCSSSKNSIFQLINSRPLIIINSQVKAIKTTPLNKSSPITSYLVNTPLSFRQSPYNDEWQIYKKIPPKYFIGIYLDFQKYIKKNSQDKLLNNLDTIISYLNHYNLDIPIIDGSDETMIDKKIFSKGKKIEYL